MTADKDGVGLLPCPFCGHVANLDKQQYAHPPRHWLKCSYCGAGTTDFSSPASAIAAWNIRLTPAQEQGLLEEAEAVLERALIGSQKYLRARVRTAISLIEKARHSSTPTEGAQ